MENMEMPLKPDCGCKYGQQPQPDNTIPSKPFGCTPKLGYAYVPVQKLNEIYTPAEGLSRGTIYPDLDKPFGMYGAEVG